MIWAFEVETSDPAFAATFFQAALKQELCLRPLGNTVYFMPPYIITPQEVDLLVQGTLRALDLCQI
jgi:adenosylmethionine-8-amino-7-oxononanoate aminotransferase